MRNGFAFHQSGEPRSGVQRRTNRYESDDSRGQYPRPRDNQFAQTRRRAPAPPPPAPLVQQMQQQEEEPPQDIYTEGGAQYVRPARPYVPDYMRAASYQTPPQTGEPDGPVGQVDYIRQNNPYVVMSEKNAEPGPKMKRRTLILLAVLAAVVFTGAWICQLIFTAQTQAVFAARAAAEGIIANRHPFPSTYRALIEREAGANNLHPAFVAAIVLNESSFNPYAESSVGARGLMQTMEDTAEWIFSEIGSGTAYSFDLMYDAETNVTYGCWYLNYLSDKFGGDPILVAAAFHSGQTNVLNWLNDKAYSADQQTIKLENFPEGNTREYVERVLNAFAAYRKLYYSDEVSV